MPSSYTSSLRLVLPVTGELTSIWGDTVNNGLTNPVEQAIAGTASIAMGDANHTLTTATESPDEARCMFITLTGAMTAQRNVVCPSYSKLYYVTNNTTGGQSILFKTSGGAGVVVLPGQRAGLYCNGTDVLVADSQSTSSGVEVDVASAATTTIGGLASNKVRITGTTTITSLGTLYIGPVFLRFAGAVTLTNGANLVLPYGNNITTKAGDLFVAWPKATTGVADGWLLMPSNTVSNRFTEDTGGTILLDVMNVRGSSFTLNTGLVAGEVYFFKLTTSVIVTAGAGLTMKANGVNFGAANLVWLPGLVSIYVETTTSYIVTGSVAA